jgi:hypothetical protein
MCLNYYLFTSLKYLQFYLKNEISFDNILTKQNINDIWASASHVIGRMLASIGRVAVQTSVLSPNFGVIMIW